MQSKKKKKKKVAIYLLASECLYMASSWKQVTCLASLLASVYDVTDKFKAYHIHQNMLFWRLWFKANLKLLNGTDEDKSHENNTKLCKNERIFKFFFMTIKANSFKLHTDLKIENHVCNHKLQ